MIPTLEATTHSSPSDFGMPLEMNSDFGALDGEARGLVERRYTDRGLTVTRERYASRNEDGDIVCSAIIGTRTVGTLSVRFDGEGGLHADLLFGAELDELRTAGIKLCEFGALAVDKHSHDPKRVLAQIFHMGYLHAHRRAHCDRLVIEVNPRHVPFYRRFLGLQPFTAARHNPRVQAPAVLMSIALKDVREQIALWGGQPELLSVARSLYPLAWDEATEAMMLARLP